MVTPQVRNIRLSNARIGYIRTPLFHATQTEEDLLPQSDHPVNGQALLTNVGE